MKRLFPDLLYGSESVLGSKKRSCGDPTNPPPIQFAPSLSQKPATPPPSNSKVSNCHVPDSAVGFPLAPMVIVTLDKLTL